MKHFWIYHTGGHATEPTIDLFISRQILAFKGRDAQELGSCLLSSTYMLYQTITCIASFTTAVYNVYAVVLWPGSRGVRPSWPFILSRSGLISGCVIIMASRASISRDTNWRQKLSLIKHDGRI
ncbi:hypothetical protein F4801DRAFT_408037 [Xylaria longipes]|nr:hypothetical protein F4801DRAFT_408037 [Xylaria longipes]